MNEMAALGQLIRHTRENRGMEAKELAARIGMNAGSLSNLERGLMKTTPEPQLLKGISHQLGIPVSEMLTTLGYLEETPGQASEAVRRLSPVIDRYTWQHGDIDRIARVIQSLGEMREGTFDVPDVEE